MRAEIESAEQRTNEHERLEDLEQFRRLTVARELETIELKNEIRRLKKICASMIAAQDPETSSSLVSSGVRRRPRPPPGGRTFAQRQQIAWLARSFMRST